MVINQHANVAPYLITYLEVHTEGVHLGKTAGRFNVKGPKKKAYVKKKGYYDETGKKHKFIL